MGGEDEKQESDERFGVHGSKDITAPGWKRWNRLKRGVLTQEEKREEDWDAGMAWSLWSLYTPEACAGVGPTRSR